MPGRRRRDRLAARAARSPAKRRGVARAQARRRSTRPRPWNQSGAVASRWASGAALEPVASCRAKTCSRGLRWSMVRTVSNAPRRVAVDRRARRSCSRSGSCWPAADRPCARGRRSRPGRTSSRRGPARGAVLARSAGCGSRRTISAARRAVDLAASAATAGRTCSSVQHRRTRGARASADREQRPAARRGDPRQDGDREQKRRRSRCPATTPTARRRQRRPRVQTFASAGATS